MYATVESEKLGDCPGEKKEKTDHAKIRIYVSTTMFKKNTPTCIARSCDKTYYIISRKLYFLVFYNFGTASNFPQLDIATPTHVCRVQIPTPPTQAPGISVPSSEF